MSTVWFEQAYLPDGWAESVLVSISETGNIDSVEVNSSPGHATVVKGLAMPGLPNVHSHAFQRAMSGLTECSPSNNKDTFWSWRTRMYDFARRISSEQLQVIANQLYMEMLKAGYTSVAEFHYLHHPVEGQPSHKLTVMSEAIIDAAGTTGIGLTLLPVLYMTSGLDNAPLLAQQSRFGHDIDGYQQLLTELNTLTPDTGNVNLGVAFHSLRACPPQAMQQTLEFLAGFAPQSPIHIHIAEQQLEVDDTLTAYAQRPVDYLLANFPVDQRWCLVHATHITDEEIQGIADSGAVVGLCPTTEANLGDGIFPMARYLKHQGQFAIGSDSNTCVNPIEELRWLEYGQRLSLQQRNVISNRETMHTSHLLINQCLSGGAQALGRNCGKMAAHHRADIIVFDEQSPIFYGKKADQWLDSVVFSANRPLVRDVMVGGQWLVSQYRHIYEADINDQFKQVMETLLKYA